MGVPKFYRWISERYPCLSEVVREYQIPEFDNLYLDMNGIIHNCSHPNDEDVHFRISEEKIFQDIFRYIEFLFRMIKPRKVFFMAIDGVAPRAKMNQQRGRRFRSAKEAETREAEATLRGETLPKEKRFDSNCITPGTEFMDRLHQHLKYFVAHKISTDDLWRDVKVILSGHETPGEGEHKIMDFIRYEKSQPKYDANTRHCLYGLDADLIMLGMCSHEPHFSLLREEVKYIRSKTDKNKRDSNPEAITFHLFHLSLFREYIDHEFEELKTTLPFDYNLENIIDDWVLMGFLVGNDFIPHIPHFHINKSSLLKLYSVYKKVMPTLDGYLNEDGKLNLSRFQKYLNELTLIDIDNFSDTYADLKYFESKTGRKLFKRDLEDTSAFFETDGAVGGTNKLSETNQLIDIANSDNENDNNYESEEVCDSSDSEGKDMFMEEFKSHKRDYYMSKLNYETVDESVLKEQAHEYIRAIQWNLHYYYDGCMSWSWFYPHHYAPYISDVHNFDDIDLNFDFGEPFKPFEQLLAVLPAASKDLLPKAFEPLVSNPGSQLIDYYPEDFETDQNEKQQAWEAVVLIPFIDEKRLLNAVKSLEKNLSRDEMRRNSHGPHLVFVYSEQTLEPFRSPNSSIFPDIIQNHSKCIELNMRVFWLPKEIVKKGLCDGVRLDVYIPGFPTLQHIPHHIIVKKERVRVFESASNGENMMLILENDISFNINNVIETYLEKTVFVNWPHLLEATVFRVSDGRHKYFVNNNQIFCEEIEDKEYSETSARVKAITRRYKERWGVITGEPDIILHVYPMTGRKYVIGSDGRLALEKQWSKQPILCPIQTVVKDLPIYEQHSQQFQTFEEIFQKSAKCFPIDNPYYGSSAVVVECNSYEGFVKVEVFPQLEPDLREIQDRTQEIINERYMTNYVLAQRLGISGHLLSRILGTIFIKLSDSDQRNRINIGLNLKFNAKNEEVPGFSMKRDDVWLFSDKVFKLLTEYMTEFPFIFEKLRTCVDKDYFAIEDLIPGENKHKTLEKLVNWLKSLESSQETRQKCNAEILDEFVVEAIEDVINTHIVFPKELAPVTQTYKPNQLFRPIHYLGYSLPDPKAKYELFDRVVNIRSGISVPLGAKGTIIGKHIDADKEVNTLYDIVFDEEFVGGTKLRCTRGKGYKLSPANLINITFGLKISGKYEQFVSSGQPLQIKPQNIPHSNRQNNYNQNSGRFQFGYTFGQRMPRPRFPNPPPFNVGANAVNPQTAISIQTLNHSKTSPFQSPKHETQKNEDFPPMQQLWDVLSQMKTNSNSLPKTSFADITAQKRLPNSNPSNSQKEGMDRKSNPKNRNQKNIPENKRYESVEQNSGQNKSFKPRVQLIESFRQILVKACEQFYNESPKFEIIKLGPLQSKSIKLVLPDNTSFIALINSYPSIDEAYEYVSRQALQSINFKFSANIDLNRPEKLLSSPTFVAPNQTSPNRPRIAESSLPRPPPKWINQNIRVNYVHKHDSRPEIPESFVEHNEQLFRELQKRNHSSRVNTTTSGSKDRNIQPKKLFDTRSDNLVNINTQSSSSSQNRNSRKIQNNVSNDNSSQRRTSHHSRNTSGNQPTVDHQFVPLQVARNNQSHRTTPQKSSAQKPKESKTLIEIVSNSSDDIEILSPETMVDISSPPKNSGNEIEILTPDSLKATSHSSGRRSSNRKPRMGANLT